ncbi:MAG TPA: hypothetical protein VHB77_16160, partial [Planctomycetaceae bacterium]|nr:hypothetical protein [Planctomycetaceae bacterium]
MITRETGARTVAKADPQKLALDALSRAVADPTPRPLFGTKAKPGVFIGSGQPLKAAAALCEQSGWLEATGEFEGKGKTRKPLYRVTAAGGRHVVEHAESAELLRDMLAVLDYKRERLQGLHEELASLQKLIGQQTEVLGQCLERLAPPDLSRVLNLSPAAHAGNGQERTDGWQSAALAYLTDYRRRNAFGFCPLPELFRQTAESRGMTIGQFHDEIRQLVADRRIRLHPFTQAAYQLQDEQYALISGQEIKYYVE